MSIAHEAIRTPRTDSTYTISSVVLNDGLVSLATRRASSRDATARLPPITSFWLVVLVLDMLLLFGGWIWRDAACPAKDCNRPETAHISLTAIPLCDLHRTMLQSESRIPPLDHAKREVPDLLDLEQVGMFAGRRCLHLGAANA